MTKTREEWIAQHQAEREAAGLSLAEQQMLQVLAEQALIGRLSRTVITGATSKGRCIAEQVGEPGEAEAAWLALMEKSRQVRVAQGGPHIGKEF